MKRFIISFIFIFVLCLPTLASRGDFVTNNEIRMLNEKVDTIGFNLLNSNGITKRTVFDVDTSNVKNAYSRSTDRQIVIYKGLLNKLSSDDEIAGVLAHEISHSVDSYNGILRGSFSGVSYAFNPKKYEYKADKRAVDYMVNAGYNPVALIVVMSRCFPQRRFDWNGSHPLTTRRMMEVYEYIYKKYPEFLANNKYKENLYYQNFLLTSQENRAKFKTKIETKSAKKLKYQ